MGHLLNPVFRSIAPKKQPPEKPAVHGLNVFAFASNSNQSQWWIRYEA
jgi:hypothetical protein